MINGITHAHTHTHIKFFMLVLLRRTSFSWPPSMVYISPHYTSYYKFLDILDDYDDYLLSRVNSSYSCFWPFMGQSRIITDTENGQVLINIRLNIWLEVKQLDLNPTIWWLIFVASFGIRLTTNLESGPRFPEIW